MLSNLFNQLESKKNLIQGHLVTKLSGESNLIYAQVPFLSDDDFYKIAEAIREDYQLNSI